MMSVACEEYIDLRREGPEKMLVVNGNLVAGDTLHTVFLTWGMYDDVKPVESAHLECYVNGKLVASTDKVTEPERFSYNANAIRFKAPFNAGDEVRITVDAGDAHAEAVAVAPNAPVVNAVDTTSFMAKNKGGELTGFYMTKVHLQDVAGESNFYRMIMSYDQSTGLLKCRPAVLTWKASSCAADTVTSSSTTSMKACCTGILKSVWRTVPVMRIIIMPMNITCLRTILSLTRNIH